MLVWNSAKSLPLFIPSAHWKCILRCLPVQCRSKKLSAFCPSAASDCADWRHKTNCDMSETWPVRRLASISCKRQTAIGLPLLLRTSKKTQITCGGKNKQEKEKKKLYLGTVCERIKNTWIFSPVYSFGPKTDYGVMLVIYVCVKKKKKKVSTFVILEVDLEKRDLLVRSCLDVQPLFWRSVACLACLCVCVCVCAPPPSILAWLTQ